MLRARSASVTRACASESSTETPGLRRPLLLEIADGEPLGGAYRPGVGRLEPGHDPQQGRLAHTVGADQTDARLRADGERDPIENDVRAEVLADARELYSHGRTSETVRARRGARENGNGVG